MNPQARDDARIRKHLVQTARALRRVNTTGLSPAVQSRRAACIALLRRYVGEGEFPRNTYVEGRRPVFVDETGRLCAVGYLIAHTWGRELTESIADRHRLDYVRDIREPRVVDWANAHGFTLAELARIQPTYEHMGGGSPGGPAQLAMWHWVVTLALPIITAAFWRIREDDDVVRGVMLGVGIWGGLMLATVGIYLTLDPYPGHGSGMLARATLAPTYWAPLNIAVAMFFIVVGWFGYEPNGVSFDAGEKARKSFMVFLIAFSLLCVTSVLPTSSRNCPDGSTNYETRLGLWFSVASPLLYPGKGRPRNWQVGNVEATGVGRALECKPTEGDGHGIVF